MPLLKRIQTIAAKVEATVGTGESLTATEGTMNAFDIDIQGEIELEEREAQGSFNRLSVPAGARKGKMSFKTDFTYDGVSIPTWASVLLPGCGFVDTANTFSPVSGPAGAAGVKTLTLGVYCDGLLKQLFGSVGNFKFTLGSGKIAVAEWEFEGVWQPVTDVAIIAPTYDTETSLRFAGATTTYGGVGLNTETIEIDAGNEIIMREDPSIVAGYESGQIVDRMPKITMNPEATLVATDDPYGDWLAGTEAAWTTSIPGDDTSTIAITAAKAQIVSVSQADRNKLVVDDIELRCNKNGATKDQELQIVFTPT